MLSTHTIYVYACINTYMYISVQKKPNCILATDKNISVGFGSGDKKNEHESI